MKLRRATTVYLAVLVLAALAVLGGALAQLFFVVSFEHVLLISMLVGLETIAFCFPLRDSPRSAFMLHTSVLFAATLVVDPAVAMLVAGSGPLVARLLRRRIRHPWHQTVFNTTQLMLQAGVGGLLLRRGGWDFASVSFDDVTMIALLGAVAIIMYGIESFAVATMEGLETHRSPLVVWGEWTHLRVELVAEFALGLLGAMIANVSSWALLLIIPPLVVVFRSNQQQLQLRKQAQELHYQAFHDPLTGLPNRALFLDRVQHALQRAVREQRTVAVLFLDLDQFKYINDSLGHDAGDQLLQAVAQRLVSCVRPSDTVARLGGDEFTLLLENIEPADQAIVIAERIKQTLSAPFAVVNQVVFVSASIGMTFSDGQRVAPHDLMRQADAAMYKAKERGRACYQIFDAHNDARALTRLQWETELRHALERHEFVVHYQPLVDLAHDTIIGFEALVRWVHPQRGLVSPAQFIPLAEDTGLILPLDQLVLRTACQQARAWVAQLPPSTPLRVSVNLSARQFQHAGLVDEVAQALRETGLEPHHLQLEITESVVMHGAPSALATLQKLKRLGVQLAIDDFGTGYSSLSYLKHFPVDTLKIDRTFVECLDQDGADAAIAQAIITLAQTLQLHTVAEGVETSAQQQALQALGCTFGQGFLWARPLPHDQAVAILEEALAAHALSVAGPE